jgi:hypothetical protein
VSTNLSIQESLYPELLCSGYSHATPHGFHLRSYREGDHPRSDGLETVTRQIDGSAGRCIPVSQNARPRGTD